MTLAEAKAAILDLSSEDWRREIADLLDIIVREAKHEQDKAWVLQDPSVALHITDKISEYRVTR